MADVFERNGYQPARARLAKATLLPWAGSGWRQLRNAANPSRESAADTEVGLYGSATQGEIAQDRGSLEGGHGLDAHQEKPQSRERPDQGQGQ